MYMDAEERKKDLLDQNEMQGLMFKMENDPRIIRGWVSLSGIQVLMSCRSSGCAEG